MRIPEYDQNRSGKCKKESVHRSVSGIEKENTALASVAAGNRSHFGIETDMHRTLDGKFVCIHDDTTKRVAIDDLTVEKSTFETLMALKLADTDGERGMGDLRIPTLRITCANAKVLQSRHARAQEPL